MVYPLPVSYTHLLVIIFIGLPRCWSLLVIVLSVPLTVGPYWVWLLRFLFWLMGILYLMLLFWYYLPHRWIFYINIFVDTHFYILRFIYLGIFPCFFLTWRYLSLIYVTTRFGIVTIYIAVSYTHLLYSSTQKPLFYKIIWFFTKFCLWVWVYVT